MAAKEKWLAGDVPGARAVLADAFAANPDAEAVWLAAFKLEFESGEPDRARAILAKARAHPPASTARVWMKSAAVERAAGDTAAEKALLDEAVKQFPAFDKLHLMAAQLAARQGDVAGARAAYARGVSRCPSSAPLWINAAHLEEAAGAVARARALLEQARARNPGDAPVWLASTRVEARAGNAAAAAALLARGLQALPNSGSLWAEAIASAPRPARRSKSVDALKRCNDDPAVLAAVASLFAADHKGDKARAWYARATKLAPGVGDYWASWYAFELAQGTPAAAASVLQAAVTAAPRHGERWTKFSKEPARAGAGVAELVPLVAADLKNPPP